METTLRVADVMTREVFAVAPDTSLETAARLLANRGIHGCPVVAEDGCTVGVVSMSDLIDPDRDRGFEPGSTKYYTLEDGFAMEFGDGKQVRDGRVEEVMTRTVFSVPENSSIVEASAHMLERGVHRLVVTDDEGVVSGIVSVVDLLRANVLERTSGSD